MSKKTKLIVGNWKMNPATSREAKSLYLSIKKKAISLKKIKTVICPPIIWLGDLNHRSIKNLALGVQDVSLEKGIGPYTGSISAKMVSYSTAEYILIGHSERRELGDTDEVINQKLKNSLEEGLIPILCVGEKVRDQRGDYLEVLTSQLVKALSGIKKNQLKNLVIAYEPVWAIGNKSTGVDTPEDFLHNSIFIRKVISKIVGGDIARSISVLYGGSVNEKNAVSFLILGQADGLLIGRASLEADKFKQILIQANNI